MKEASGLPNYVSVASKPSKYPARQFCSICGYPFPLRHDFFNARNRACYKCKTCGSLYCSYLCKKSHEETKCVNMNYCVCCIRISPSSSFDFTGILSMVKNHEKSMAAVKRAFCIGFTGQGSQWVGMGKTLLSQFPKAKEMMEEANEVMGYSLSDIMFFGPEVMHKEMID